MIGKNIVLLTLLTSCGGELDINSTSRAAIVWTTQLVPYNDGTVSDWSGAVTDIDETPGNVTDFIFSQGLNTQSCFYVHINAPLNKTILQIRVSVYAKRLGFAGTGQIEVAIGWQGPWMTSNINVPSNVFSTIDAYINPIVGVPFISTTYNSNNTVVCVKANNTIQVAVSRIGVSYKYNTEEEG